MNARYALTSAAAVLFASTLMACSAATPDATAPQTPKTPAPSAAVADAMPTEDLSNAVSGTYIGDSSHTYVGLTYLHQGYARATLRVDNVQIKLDFDSSAPESSALSVMMKSSEINSGTDKFDDHLMGPDFFESDVYPDITFTSTSMTLKTPSTGTLTGDLTIKDVTRPVILDVKLNKIGQHFRSKADMMGLSATGEISRTSFGLGKYAPMVGDTVTLAIEAEMAVAKE